ncbi:MAG: hypothetical protein B6D64_03920 [Bacteroidetes bacterium 4484_276]|nr:MAG: hypothetical protein B6D64_03920 [Bacteroidetes bacterium 4484_276]
MSGKAALLDSNIIIYISRGELDFISIVVDYDDIQISIISYMEVLGFKFRDDIEKQKVIDLLDNFEIIWLNKSIVEEVISIRQKIKISLPDAIIAASARTLKFDLFTRNINDFKNISGLNVINPF